MIRYGVPLALSEIPAYLGQGGRIAQLLAAALLAPKALGYIAVAATWGSVLLVGSNVVGSVVFARTITACRRGNQISEILRGTRAVVVLTFIAGGSMIIICPIVTPVVFGKEFDAATPISILFLLAAAIEAVKSVLNNGMKALGRSRAVLAAEVGGIVVSSATVLALVPALGLAAVGSAMVLGNVVTTALLFGGIHRERDQLGLRTETETSRRVEFDLGRPWR
jgi:O-antigen/teichoic acid export membrane protein